VARGYLALVLHAHLPFVRHPEYEDFLEEDWFYEAVLETYIPLLEVFERLVNDGVDFRLTLSLSPTLVSMLVDPLLRARFVRHVERLIELAEKEIVRTRWLPEFNALARMYHRRFVQAREAFVGKYRQDLVGAFRRLQELGCLELITCAATHAFIPLLDGQKPMVRGQVHTAVKHHLHWFGQQPRGIWLPECGYAPGVEEVLTEAGLKFFFLDAHGVLFASPRPRYGVFAPIRCRNGVVAFGRDIASSRSVWSATEGYPGDVWYRDFYRDIGFDLDYEYLRPYLPGDGLRVYTGIKYYRITGKTEHKAPYVREVALQRAAEHAEDFALRRVEQVERLFELMGRRPLVVSPYDAELFGHWWFEGPEWLEFLLRRLAGLKDSIQLVTPSAYLAENPDNQVAEPAFSSWGYKGYCEVWLDGSNDWIYPHLHRAAEGMAELARGYPEASGVLARALRQAAREVLLAQSSDWAFIMKTGTMVPYAVRRTKEHLLRFQRLYQDIKAGTIDEAWLSEVEGKDNIFPLIDYQVFARE